MTTTIVIADDHHVVREGLRILLEAEPGFVVAGEAGDGLDAVRLTEQVQPRVLVVDLGLPGIHGIEVIRQVRRRAPETRVVVLSMHSEARVVRDALRAGATAYVSKGNSAEELTEAIRRAAEGRSYLSPSLNYDPDEGGTAAAADAYDALTPREREVLHLAAHALTNAEMGARLRISPRTVEIHRANMMRKLGLRTPLDLVRCALERGILGPDESSDDPST